MTECVDMCVVVFPVSLLYNGLPYYYLLIILLVLHGTFIMFLRLCVCMCMSLCVCMCVCVCLCIRMCDRRLW